MNILHKIRALLYNNPLTENPNDYLARVSSDRSLSIHEICESAVNRGGATISAASMEHAVKLFFNEQTYLLCDGYSINTGYYQASPLINGVFINASDTFDASRHTISFQFKQGALLRKELDSVSVEITGVAETGAIIAQITDVKTGLVNNQLTPNRNLKIKGDKIKIAGDNPNVGVYFINQATNESTKVDASDIVTNYPSELIIIIPALAAGTYKLQVTTQFSGHNLLKEPRSVIFNKDLTVA